MKVHASVKEQLGNWKIDLKKTHKIQHRGIKKWKI